MDKQCMYNMQQKAAWHPEGEKEKEREGGREGDEETGIDTSIKREDERFEERKNKSELYIQYKDRKSEMNEQERKSW